MKVEQALRYWVWVAGVVVALCVAGVVLIVIGRAAAEGGGSAWWLWAGVALVLLGAFLAWNLMWWIATCAPKTPIRPEQLQRELDGIAAGKQFQERMKRLRPEDPPGAGEWRLRLARLLADRDSHVTFEALAVRNGEEVRLWGKRYRWITWFRAWQRLFLPSYESATWAILTTMYEHGVDGPVPLVFRRLRALGFFPAGCIILAEHVGPVRAFKDLTRKEFDRLEPEQRRALIVKLGDFIRRIHALGIYDFTPRYFNVKGLDGPVEEMKIYLFDLDKAHLLRVAPGWLRRYSESRGLTRIRRFLREHVSAEEVAAFEEALGKPPQKGE